MIASHAAPSERDANTPNSPLRSNVGRPYRRSLPVRRGPGGIFGNYLTGRRGAQSDGSRLSGRMHQ